MALRNPRMIAYRVELSGENLPLARAELEGAVCALGGRSAAASESGAPETYVAVELPEEVAPSRLTERLAMARRCLRPIADDDTERLARWFRTEGARGATAAFRVLGGARRSLEGTPALAWARAYADGGGSIDLEAPARRFWVGADPGRGWIAYEEVGRVDRRSTEARRMPKLPFRRPVSLPPRLGRAAANLARLRAGDRVVDPFVGTGALLLEAALLGARVSGGDRDPTMVRGTLQNLAAFGRSADALRVRDAADVFDPPDGGTWDAVLTDPPYGRASGSAGEPPEELVRRALAAWAPRVRPEGRIVVILPGGEDPVGEPWRCTVRVRDRVHRRLTREFRVYERGDAARPA